MKSLILNKHLEEDSRGKENFDSEEVNIGTVVTSLNIDSQMISKHGKNKRPF